MTQEQIELLSFTSENGEVNAEEVADHFDISGSTAYKRLAVLRKHDLARRVRNENNELVHVITDKGKDALGSTGQNPKEKIKSKIQEVKPMTISVKIADDLVGEIESLMEEEELSSYSEAVDFVISDYFDLIEEELPEEA